MPTALVKRLKAFSMPTALVKRLISQPCCKMKRTRMAAELTRLPGEGLPHVILKVFKYDYLTMSDICNLARVTVEAEEEDANERDLGGDAILAHVTNSFVLKNAGDMTTLCLELSKLEYDDDESHPFRKRKMTVVSFRLINAYAACLARSEGRLFLDFRNRASYGHPTYLEECKTLFVAARWATRVTEVILLVDHDWMNVQNHGFAERILKPNHRAFPQFDRACRRLIVISRFNWTPTSNPNDDWNRPNGVGPYTLTQTSDYVIRITNRDKRNDEPYDLLADLVMTREIIDDLITTTPLRDSKRPPGNDYLITINVHNIPTIDLFTTDELIPEEMHNNFRFDLSVRGDMIIHGGLALGEDFQFFGRELNDGRLNHASDFKWNRVIEYDLVARHNYFLVETALMLEVE